MPGVLVGEAAPLWLGVRTREGAAEEGRDDGREVGREAGRELGLLDSGELLKSSTKSWPGEGGFSVVGLDQRPVGEAVFIFISSKAEWTCTAAARE